MDPVLVLHQAENGQDLQLGERTLGDLGAIGGGSRLSDLHRNTGEGHECHYRHGCHLRHHTPRAN